LIVFVNKLSYEWRVKEFIQSFLLLRFKNCWIINFRTIILQSCTTTGTWWILLSLHNLIFFTLFLRLWWNINLNWNVILLVLHHHLVSCVSYMVFDFRLNITQIHWLLLISQAVFNWSAGIRALLRCCLLLLLLLNWTAWHTPLCLWRWMLHSHSLHWLV